VRRHHWGLLIFALVLATLVQASVAVAAHVITIDETIDLPLFPGQYVEITRSYVDTRVIHGLYDFRIVSVESSRFAGLEVTDIVVEARAISPDRYRIEVSYKIVGKYSGVDGDFDDVFTVIAQYSTLDGTTETVEVYGPMVRLRSIEIKSVSVEAYTATDQPLYVSGCENMANCPAFTNILVAKPVRYIVTLTLDKDPGAELDALLVFSLSTGGWQGEIAVPYDRAVYEVEFVSPEASTQPHISIYVESGGVRFLMYSSTVEVSAGNLKDRPRALFTVSEIYEFFSSKAIQYGYDSDYYAVITVSQVNRMTIDATLRCTKTGEVDSVTITEPGTYTMKVTAPSSRDKDGNPLDGCGPEVEIVASDGSEPVVLKFRETRTPGGLGDIGELVTFILLYSMLGLLAMGLLAFAGGGILAAPDLMRFGIASSAASIVVIGLQALIFTGLWLFYSVTGAGDQVLIYEDNLGDAVSAAIDQTKWLLLSRGLLVLAVSLGTMTLALAGAGVSLFGGAIANILSGGVISDALSSIVVMLIILSILLAILGFTMLALAFLYPLLLAVIIVAVTVVLWFRIFTILFSRNLAGVMETLLNFALILFVVLFIPVLVDGVYTYLHYQFIYTIDLGFDTIELDLGRPLSFVVGTVFSVIIVVVAMRFFITRAMAAISGHA